ncbi:precorrin-8X methylmutase, partial [Pyrobaculum sp.]|uniref:precorrin-8X methylmutase n=1 Tax=Pyrobaculum sp. TaxID=2004705 RepID=UPI003D0AD29A
YNEYAEPNWRDLVARHDRVVIALAFLGRGNHVVRDILGELGVEPGMWAISKFGNWVYVTPPLGDSPLCFSALLARIRRALGGGGVELRVAEPEEIDNSSMRYVAERLGLDLANWRDRLVARAVYASGNLDVARHVEIRGEVLEAFREWLGGSVAVDSKMVKAGLRYPPESTYVAVEAPVDSGGLTKSYAGMTYWLSRLKSPGAVVGNAPTALAAVLDHCMMGGELSYIIAAPVGFTNIHVKDKVAECAVPSVVVKGTYGGSGVAAAIFNELLELSHGG